MIVDAHAHVFLARTDDPQRTVDAIAPADRAAPVGELLTTMRASGVDRAVLLPLGPEDGYVAAVLRDHPDTFRGIAVDDPDEPNVVDVLARVRDGGFSGLRMFALPEGDRERWSRLVAGLADLGAVLWMYPRPDDVDAVATVAARHPQLRIVLNHSGLCQAGIGVDATGRPRIAAPVPQPSAAAVAALARHDNVAVVLSGAYAFSREPYPYADIAGHVRMMAGAFGPARLLWASDFPWILDDPGYAALLDLVDHHLPGLSAGDRAAVLGDNCRRLLWES